MPFRPCVLAAALAVLGLASCVPAAVGAERGSLLSATPIARLSATQAATTLRSAGLPTRRARRGISAYRLRYVTVGVDHAAITASALVVLPHGARRLPTVAFEHGTLVRRTDAPSQGLDSFASSAVVLYGAAGFATVAPDYLGLGSGAGRQAYLHAATEASASIDALRAARTFARSRGRRLDTRILVTGFSQGGHAAMALGQALQRGAAPRLHLRALAPVSGVFDLQGAEIPAILDGSLDGRISAYNVSALLTSWHPIYHLYGSLDDAIAPSYAERVRRLFDGRHGDSQILAAMPTRVSDLLTLAGLDHFQHPDGALLAGMRANDATCQWKPRTPVRLYAASRDRAVTSTNSEHCARELRARHAHVDVIQLGPVDHFPSMFVATPEVLDWFAHLTRTP
jgi:predicted esterase